MPDGVLVYVMSEGVATADGQTFMSAKTVTGLDKFASFWDGPMIVLAAEEPDVARASHGDGAWRPRSRRWSLQVDRDPLTIAGTLGADVVAVPITIHTVRQMAARSSVPWVPLAEFDLKNRYLTAVAARPGPVARLRAAQGLLRRERYFQRLMRSAAGAQFNGWPAWQAYHDLNPKPLLYFDSRLAEDDVVSAGQRPPTPRDGPLRLAFSGRWIHAKGVLDALDAFRILTQELRVPATLEVFGGGELEPEVRSRAAQIGASVRGTIDFATEWLPHFRTHVDLLVAPHVQGDPSCTYLEAMGSGVPVVGYDNDSLAGFAREWKSGWATPSRDPRRLAQQIASLSNERSRIDAARTEGLRHAREHTFAAECERRVAHWRAIAGSGGARTNGPHH